MSNPPCGAIRYPVETLSALAMGAISAPSVKVNFATKTMVFVAGFTAPAITAHYTQNPQDSYDRDVGLSILGAMALNAGNLCDLFPQWITELESEFCDYAAPFSQGISATLLTGAEVLLFKPSFSIYLALPILNNLALDYVSSENEEAESKSWTSRVVTYLSPYLIAGILLHSKRPTQR